MSEIISFITDTVSQFGYIGIVVMMFLESSFFPFPSEVVIIPAGYLVYKGEMNLYLVFLSGALGSILGALFNYYIALYIGKAILLRYGKYIGLNEEKFNKLNSFFNKHGAISTFIGRLIPGIRQYISFPAGLSKMNIFKFILYTFLGAGIWVIVLIALGYFVGGNEILIKKYSKIILLIIILFAAFILSVYIYINKKKHEKA